MIFSMIFSRIFLTISYHIKALEGRDTVECSDMGWLISFMSRAVEFLDDVDHEQ